MRNESRDRIWVTSFTDEALKVFFEHFMFMESDPYVQIIPVVVSSYGGSTDNLTAMRDLIKSSQKPTSVTAIGKAMSSGAALLAAGTKGLRFVAPNTSIMIHGASASSWGKVEDMANYTEHLKKVNKRFLSDMSKDMGHEESWVKNELLKRVNQDWFFTADEAVKIGLADGVGIPRTSLSMPQQVVSVDVKKPKKFTKGPRR